MICERCGRHPAVSRVTVTEQGVPVSKHVCRSCALELMGFQVPSVQRCPTCGMTRERLLNVRKAGCPRCYDVFREDLLKLVRWYQQGHDHHVGSVPEQLRSPTERVQERVERLAQELRRAVEKEDYARAARIKQELDQLSDRGDA